MEQTITAKIRLYPTPEQENEIDATLRAYQNALNFASKTAYPKIQTRKNGTISKTISAAKIQEKCYPDLRADYGLKSQQACSACKTVAATYKTIKTNKHELKHAPVYRHAPVDLVRGHDYTIKDDYISITTLEEKRAKIRYFIPDYFKQWFAIGKLGSAKMFKKHGKYYLHISVTIEIDDATAPDGETMFVGIDRGIRFLVAAYDSAGQSTFFSGKEVKEKRKQYKAKRKELQQKGTPSARHRLKAMGSRENRWTDDVNHCLSKALVEKYPAGTVFVLEDLDGIRGALVKVRRKNRYEYVSWAYADLAFKLMYKAALRGQRVVYVDPAYSSQECPVCGHVSKDNRDKHSHVFECEDCGFRSNDDKSAAMVLLGRGREKVLAELVEQGSSQPGFSQ